MYTFTVVGLPISQKIFYRIFKNLPKISTICFMIFFLCMLYLIYWQFYINFYIFVILWGEGSLGLPDLWSGQKLWWNWYLTLVVNLSEVQRAQLAKSTLLTSSLVSLGSFYIFIYTGSKGNKCHPFNNRRGRLKGPNMWSIHDSFFFSGKGFSCSVSFTSYCLYH